jgi:hypothetical protein
MAARINTTPTLDPGVPEKLFDTGLRNARTFHPYGVTKDGQRFLIPVGRASLGSAPITIVLNWPATLAK